jgi:hypothetical protein
VEFIYFYWVLCGRVEGWLSGGWSRNAATTVVVEPHCDCRGVERWLSLWLMADRKGWEGEASRVPSYLRITWNLFYHWGESG